MSDVANITPKAKPKSRSDVGLLFTFLSIVAGGFSVSRVIQSVSQLGFPETIQALLERWDSFLRDLAQPFEPALLALVQTLSDALDLGIVHLYPHWKHILLLVLLYPLRDARGHWGLSRDPHATALPGAASRYRYSALFRAIWGPLIAVGISLGVGSISLEGADLLANALIVFVPIIGLWVYLVGAGIWGASFLLADLNMSFRRDRSFAQDLSVRLRDATTLALWGVLLALASLLGSYFYWPELFERGQVGLLTLGGLVILLAIKWLTRGARQASDSRNDGDSWMRAYFRLHNVQMGLQMLLIFVLPFVFVVVALS